SRGGPLFPAIFLGTARAELAHVWFDVSPTLAVAVGAAAGMAAGTRLLITSTLFASLLVGTRGLDAVPAAGLAAGSGALARGGTAEPAGPGPEGDASDAGRGLMHVDAGGRRLWFDVEGTALVPDGPAMR